MPFKPQSDAFQRGNFHAAAVTGAADRWETHAARGLCGDTEAALARICDHPDKRSRFYEAVLRWMDGQDAAAAAILTRCGGAHAQNLLALVKKPRIQVLSQLPWQLFGKGPHGLLDGGRGDPKFEIRNIGFAGGDLRNAPAADIHRYYDRSAPPDFYLAQMIEWQMVPPNLQELPCPLIGQTADYDLHLHVLRPWLDLFDEILVTDATEHDDVSRLVSVPVTTFPKAFNVPPTMPPPKSGPAPERDIDVLVTGSAFHPFHPDKAALVRALMDCANVRTLVVNGYLDQSTYFELLSRTKFALSYVRHPGATPTRGLEALAAGAVLLAQPECVLRLWTDRTGGIVPYDGTGSGLVRALTAALGDYSRHAAGAGRAAVTISDEFDMWRVASQYLRLAAVLAARPRDARRMRSPPMQQRPVAWTGWLQPDASPTYRAIRNAAVARYRALPAHTRSPADFAAPAREMMLEYVHHALLPSEKPIASLLESALQLYRSGVRAHPRSLMLRFNLVRAALHFGAPADVNEALTVAAETVVADPASLSLAPEDDPMTWDYCEGHFNFRSYTSEITAIVTDRHGSIDRAKALVLASLNGYLGRMGEDAAGYGRAHALDPHFGPYRLGLARALAARGNRAGADAALPHLLVLSRDGQYAYEAWTLLEALADEHGIAVPERAALGAAMSRLAGQTFLERDGFYVRRGPYHRAQRLDLARNPGVRAISVVRRSVRPQLSILLADMNGGRYPRFVSSLPRQTLPRPEFEIVCAEVYERRLPAMAAVADVYVACGQTEPLPNVNAAFNEALARSAGETVLFLDGDAALAPNALAGVLDALDGQGIAVAVAVPAGGGAAPGTFALPRAEALRLCGLDESRHAAGAADLARRAFAAGASRIAVPALPFLSGDRETPIGALLGRIAPFRYSDRRSGPWSANPAVAPARAARELARIPQ